MTKTTSLFASKLTILFIFLLFSQLAAAQLNLKKIDKSVEKFISQIDVEKDTVPDNYFMTYEQFDEMWKVRNASKKYVKEKVDKAYRHMKVSTRKTFAKIVKSNEGEVVIQSIDTVTYVRDRVPLMKVFVDCKRPFYLTMVRIENEVYLTSNIHRDDKDDFNHSMRYVLQDYWEGEMWKHAPCVPTSTVILDILPYRNKQGLWGFKSLTAGNITLTAQYDSIWSYSANYWMLHREAGYNLIDTSHNILLFNDAKYMRQARSRKPYRIFYEQSNDGVNWRECVPEVRNGSNMDEPVDLDEVEEIDLSIESVKSHNTKPKTVSNRSYELSERQQKEDEALEKELRMHTMDQDTTHYQFVIKNKTDTLFVSTDYRQIRRFGPILIGEKNRYHWDILSREGEVLQTLKYMITWKASKSGIIELFDPITRRFGMYSVYTNVLIEPKYKTIYAAERGAFYYVWDGGTVYYLNAKGEAQ